MTSPPHEPPPPAYELANGVLEHRLTKAALAAFVILSLLPIDAAVERTLRPLFLAVFGLELATRWVLWRRRNQPVNFPTAVFAFADVLAFVSFLPVELVIGDDKAHVLALLRLTRLLMLMRFAKELAVDIYAIMTRREQVQQFALVTGAVMVLTFISAVILAQLRIPHDHVDDPHFFDQLWWSFRQMESADNLVPTIRNNPVLVALSLGLTVTGVFVISFIIGIGSSVVDQLVRAERRRALAYRDHTVVIGPVHASEVLIGEFVRIYAKNRQIPSPERLLTWLRHASPWQSTRSFPRVALLGQKDEPPAFLYEPLMRWVVYRQGDPGEPSSLDRVAASKAKRAIILARDELVHETDAVSIATLAAFRAKNPEAHAFVEVGESASVPLVQQVGGPGTFTLDVPHLLGMFLCQHLVTPGVERLYRDLLTADGSEIYTHVFVDDDDKAALRRLAAQRPTLPFADLQRWALPRGVYLFGALLGKDEVSRGKGGIVPVDGLVHWVNPLVLPDDDARPAALGAAAGMVPLASLRGLIGIAESYLPLAAVSKQLAAGARTDPAATTTDDAALHGRIRAMTTLPPPGPKRVVLIGASDALPSLLRELSRYVPGVEATLFLSTRGDERTPLPRRLEMLGVGFDAQTGAVPGVDGLCFPLERDGKLTVYTHAGPDLAGFAARALQKLPPVEAAVFLSEPDGDERDARTGMRILRFVRLLEENKVPRADTLHMLAEFISVEKGAHVQSHIDSRKCGFHDEASLRLTLVSTGTVRNYFMVHSAFVPGVVDLYEHLLEERGQEIVRLKIDADGGAPITMRAIQQALAPHHAIAFALEKRDRDVVLAPPADRAFAPADLSGVYVVGDVPHLHAAYEKQKRA